MPESFILPEFSDFAKMARFSRRAIVTEKIDGTNGQINIVNLNENPIPQSIIDDKFPGVIRHEEFILIPGSRNGWLTSKPDNYGFHKWVEENKAELVKLGPGRHFGEWWGSGINRGYGFKKGERFFSLFNVQRWHSVGETPLESPNLDPRKPSTFTEVLPACCLHVPILWIGQFDEVNVNHLLTSLKENGSVAAPGFDNPEGIVIFHVAANVGFKKTINKDEQPKGFSGS